MDKDLGVTFHIHKSGSDGAVYASPPFRHDYIVYANDKEPRYCSMTSAARDCPGKDDTTKCLGHPTRTFIGYLRQEGPDWLPFDKSGSPVTGEFDRQETAAYAIYRANQQRVISKHKAQGKRRVESVMSAKTIVNSLLEDESADAPEVNIERFAKAIGAEAEATEREVLVRFKRAVRGYIKWCHAGDEQGQGYDDADLVTLRKAKTFAEAEAILRQYESEPSFLYMVRSGYFV